MMNKLKKDCPAAELQGKIRAVPAKAAGKIYRDTMLNHIQNKDS